MSVPRSEIGALHPREDAVHVSVTREHALGRGQGVHGPGPLPTELGDPALSDRCQHCRILCAAARAATAGAIGVTVVAERSEEHTSELQSRRDLVCRLLLEKKKS